jgi:signal peptidase I
MTDESKPRRGGATTLAFLALGFVLLFAIMPFGPGVRFFRMPSGSMQPTLHVGDHFMVTKWTYGYGRYSLAPFEIPMSSGRILGSAPLRGDLAVFRPISEPNRDFVKRVIGLPGDRIQMIDGVLHINGEAVEREDLGIQDFENEDGVVEGISTIRETLPNGVSYLTFDRNPLSELDNTRVYQVPEGHYFMMGDDRDNSADSRVSSLMGYVPIENFVGRLDWVLPRANAE